MKNLNLLMGLGFAALSMSAQAQTIVSLGFEEGDATGKSSQYSLTPGLSKYGDWVNVKDVDQWNEAYAEDARSGEYAFQAVNGETAGQSWDRGFKIAGIDIKENTPYRVSFWIKADPTYEEDGTAKNTCLTSWLSQGIENFDKSINSPSGYNYGVQMTSGLTGEWQYISFVSYYTNSETLNSIIANQSWVGNAVFPENFGGDGTQTYAEYFDHKLPQEFFLIINMYSPTTYTLDDIRVEEGVTFNQARFYGNAIRLDFGYQTNIAALANANDGYLKLDPSCVAVTVNGEPLAAKYVEGMPDGYLYIFFDEDEVEFEDEDDIKVSFTPADDCPIVYNTDRRPSSDVEGDMKVLGFENETAILADDDFDVFSSAWSPAKLVSTVPENESFEIDPTTFNNISLTYDKELDLQFASASLMQNGLMVKDLTENMTMSEDLQTINIAVSDLADGEYTLIVSGVTNVMGFECESDQVITFAVGADSDDSKSESVYSTNETFSQTANGTFPVGWVANDNGTIHQYGLTDAGDVWNYNWGGNVGGGGCRAMTGYSGDLNGAAIYWRSMNGANALGTLTYGEQVKDWTLQDGTLDPEMPEGISLYLDARKYQITIRMCAWKNLNGNTDAVSEENAPKYDFTLEDMAGNVYARFSDVPAMPNVNGAQNMAVTGVTRSQTDFTVDKAGYYMLKFSTTQPNGEYLLGGVDLITMPSKAAYWKQQLAEAVEAAEAIMETAEAEDYDGETKTAFAAAINSGKTGHFTSPSAINALIDELKTLGEAMAARVKNYDDFFEAVLNASVAYEDLEGKYKEAELAVNAKALIDQYETVDPSTLSDAELAEAAPKLVTAAAQLANVKDVVDILTWRAYKASQTATTLGVDEATINTVQSIVTDDDEVIAACNEASKLSLYNLIATNGITDEMKSAVKYDAGQKTVVDGVYTDMTGEEIAAEGIDFTCLIKNPHLYSYSTDFGAALKDNTVVGWNCTQYEGGSVHLNGTSATAEKPVSTGVINAYGGGAEYNFYQVIENVPVGIYDVYIASRTALKNNVDADGVKGVFNAMNDETGIWDKYIYAQVDDEDPIMVPFSAGSSWAGHPTAIRNVAVGEGQKLTIGVVEHLTSGKASGHDFDAETGAYVSSDWWNTNTFAGDARLFFAAPLDGYNYAEQVTAIESKSAAAGAQIAKIYNVAGSRQNALQKGINIVKYTNGSVKKVLVK